MAPKPKPDTPIVDWAAVREEYENSDIGFSALIRRHKIRSPVQLVRRRDKEGWKKSQEVITANLVTASVADLAAAEMQREKTLTTETYKENIDLTSTVTSQNGAYIASSENVTPNVIDVKNPPEPKSQTEQRDHDDAQIVRRAKGLATLHSEEIRKQVEVAGRIQELGLAITERLMVAILSEDLAEKQAAQRALLAINPDKETLAALSKAAQTLIEGSVIMRRRALGMDVLKPAQMLPEGVKAPKAVADVLKALPLDTLMKLRQVTVEVSRLPPPPVTDIIEGSLAEETNA